MAAADEVEASQSAADGDLNNAEPSEDQAASTSGLAGLDPATRVIVQQVTRMLTRMLTLMAALVEQKVQEGVNAKVAELQQAAEPKTPSCTKVPLEVNVSISFSIIATCFLSSLLITKMHISQASKCKKSSPERLFC